MQRGQLCIYDVLFDSVGGEKHLHLLKWVRLLGLFDGYCSFADFEDVIKPSKHVCSVLFVQGVPAPNLFLGGKDKKKCEFWPADVSYSFIYQTKIACASTTRKGKGICISDANGRPVCHGKKGVWWRRREEKKGKREKKKRARYNQLGADSKRTGRTNRLLKSSREPKYMFSCARFSSRLAFTIVDVVVVVVVVVDGELCNWRVERRQTPHRRW